MRSILPVLFCLGTGSLQAAISGLDVSPLKGPSCVIVDSVRNSQVGLAPFFTRVNVVVSDGIAQATMVQSFANPLKTSTEIGYVFPLPEKGAVHAMSYQIHDSLFRATIQEKQRAQSIYDSVKNAGGNAAILLQEKPNIFQQKMANVRAGDTVHVQIELTIPLKYADGSWELAFPTMVGERFQSSGVPGSIGTISGWNPPEDRDGPAFQFNVLLKDVALDSIWSPTHPIGFEDPVASRQMLSRRGLLDSVGRPVPASYGRAILLEPRTTYPNHDFVLRMHRKNTSLDAVVSSWKPSVHDTGYFHMAILPDLGANATTRPALDLVLLVDRSGSQGGWPMDREKQIATSILQKLSPSDRFTLLAFDDYNEFALGSIPVAATASNLDSAQRFLSKLYARGGTQLLSAIKAALSTPISGDMQRLFVFLTDGFITDEASILDALAKKSPRPQVLTFGCGDNLNRYFLEEAASLGGGFSTLLTSSEAATPAVEAAWSRIDAPQVQALRIDFGSAGAHDLILPASDRLYKGLPLVADGKYLAGGKQTITLKGQRNGQPWTLSRDFDLVEEDGLAWSVPKSWARAAIGHLETVEGTTTANRDTIVRLSSAYQVLSKYTAFLAVGGAPVEPDASLANAYHSSLITEVRQNLSMARSDFRTMLDNGRLLIRWNLQDRVDRIRILDLSGTVVRTLQPFGQNPEASWDGRSDRGARMVAGTYVVELHTGKGPQSARFAWIP